MIAVEPFTAEFEEGGTWKEGRVVAICVSGGRPHYVIERTEKGLSWLDLQTDIMKKG